MKNRLLIAIGALTVIGSAVAYANGIRCTHCKGTGFLGNFTCAFCKGTGSLNY